MAIIDQYNETLISVSMNAYGDLHIVERKCLSDFDSNPNEPDVIYRDKSITIEARDVKEFLRLASLYFAPVGEGREDDGK